MSTTVTTPARRPESSTTSTTSGSMSESDRRSWHSTESRPCPTVTEGSARRNASAGQPARRRGQVVPPHPAVRFDAEHDIQPGTPGITIRQQHVVTPAPGDNGQRGGEHRSPRTAASADNGNTPAVARSADGSVGQHADQEFLRLFQQDRAVHAQADALFPETGVGFAAGDNHHAGPSTEPGSDRPSNLRARR